MKALSFIRNQSPWLVSAVASITVLTTILTASIIVNTKTPDSAIIAQLESEIQNLDDEISALESQIALSNNPEEKAKIEVKIAAKQSERSELSQKVNNIEQQIQAENTPQNTAPEEQPTQQNETSNKKTSQSQSQNQSQNQAPEQPSYIPVSKVEINCPNEDVHPHTSIDLSAIIYPSNATDQNVHWSSSNLTVTDDFTLPHLKDQSFNINAVGTSVITVTAADGASTTCTLNSTALAMRDFIIRPQSDRTIFKEGEQNLLFVEFEPTYTTNRTIHWQSSNTDIATVEWFESGSVQYKGQEWGVSQGAALVTFGSEEGRVEITAISDDGGYIKVIRYDNYKNI